MRLYLEEIWHYSDIPLAVHVHCTSAYDKHWGFMDLVINTYIREFNGLIKTESFSIAQ